jgi:hypothetical protein
MGVFTNINSQNPTRTGFVQIFSKYPDKGELDSLRTISPESVPNGAGLVIRGVCKSFEFLYLFFPENKRVQQLPVERKETIVLPAVSKHTPLLKVSGNVLYDVNYRSRVDTPYAENNVYQHTIQTRLDIVYKDKYPLKLYVTTRFGNSPLFRKYTDLNFQFNHADFNRTIKQQAWNAVESLINSQMAQLDSLRRLIDAKKLAIASLSHSIQGPDIAQALVEEREKNIFRKQDTSAETGVADVTDIKNQIKWPEKFRVTEKSTVDLKIIEDSVETKQNFGRQGSLPLVDSFYKKRKKLDSLTAELQKAEKLYSELNSLRQLKTDDWRKKIESAKDANTLVQQLHQLNISDTVLPKGYKTLSAIRSFGIGRSIADYSELSVRNISITGFQLEYNPNNYYAVAVGKVDYRFRDYIIPSHVRSNQYVALIRFGRGLKNGNHMIFTYFTGRRQFFNSSVAVQPGSTIPEYNLAGITIEGFYKVNRNISIIGEIAKSTIPYYSLAGVKKGDWISSVTRFKDRSNEAYSMKLSSFFPRTKTRFAGNLRYTGANFQSFSTFTTGASQLRWAARVEQPFFKNQLSIVSSLQQNDYNNPFVTTAYKSSTMLASAQANLRIKKWPVFSFGYYPSYQLTKAGDDHYSETRYYTLLASAGYYYHINKIQLSTYTAYSQFYNQASDSGFVYFNSKNVLLSQNIFFSRCSIVLNASMSDNYDYNIYTVENNAQFTINRFITAGGGVKMIKHSLYNLMHWGYNGNIALTIPHIGDIQFMMDTGFIPGINRQLVENKTGRLTYYKTF